MDLERESKERRSEIKQQNELYGMICDYRDRLAGRKKLHFQIILLLEFHNNTVYEVPVHLVFSQAVPIAQMFGPSAQSLLVAQILEVDFVVMLRVDPTP